MFFLGEIFLLENLMEKKFRLWHGKNILKAFYAFVEKNNVAEISRSNKNYFDSEKNHSPPPL